MQCMADDVHRCTGQWPTCPSSMPACRGRFSYATMCMPAPPRPLGTGWPQRRAGSRERSRSSVGARPPTRPSGRLSARGWSSLPMPREERQRTCRARWGSRGRQRLRLRLGLHSRLAARSDGWHVRRLSHGGDSGLHRCGWMGSVGLWWHGDGGGRRRVWRHARRRRHRQLGRVLSGSGPTGHGHRSRWRHGCCSTGGCSGRR
mmetsp:Transcript_7552/g.19269  ORF Transcript_7552/g.19269 Transcript_7552/m.19269 type:complete len:203 (-) Transcript_7552:563-1171(-)